MRQYSINTDLPIFRIIIYDMIDIDKNKKAHQIGTLVMNF